jgi:hypothetical protein
MISRFCIDRPIFAAVLSIAGLAAMSTLPIASPGPIERGLRVDRVLPAFSQSAPVAQPESAATTPGRPGEELTQISMQGRDALLDVYRARGIGGTQLRMPDRCWPARVTVRFHGFPALEAFTADAASGRLECMLQRPEKRAAQYVCRFGTERVDALSQREGVFLLSLPARMLVSGNEKITLQWVDQWR